MRARRIAACALLIAAVFFGTLGWKAAGALEREAGYATLAGIRGLTAGRFDDISKAEAQEKEPVGFALWSQTENHGISATVSGRSGGTVALLQVKGDTRLVLPGSATLAEEDATGCLIDERTALALSGNGDALGMELELEGNRYRVRGIVESPVPVAVVRPRERAAAMENMTLDREAEASAFAMRHGLSGSLEVKGSLYGSLARLFQWLPVYAAAAVILLLLLRLRRRWREYPLRAVALELACFALVTGMALLLLAILPDGIIPTRWSDFGHWSGLVSGGREYMARYFSLGRSCQDYRMLSGLAGSMAGGLSALLLVWSGRLARTGGE